MYTNIHCVDINKSVVDTAVTLRGEEAGVERSSDDRILLVRIENVRQW